MVSSWSGVKLTWLVILQVAIFYLVLRALDTIEDDMTLPIEKKEPLLLDFHNVLEKDGWNFTECEYNLGAGLGLSQARCERDDAAT
jgi:phytoene/squalene synthetase